MSWEMNYEEFIVLKEEFIHTEGINVDKHTQLDQLIQYTENSAALPFKLSRFTSEPSSEYFCLSVCLTQSFSDYSTDVSGSILTSEHDHTGHDVDILQKTSGLLLKLNCKLN